MRLIDVDSLGLFTMDSGFPYRMYAGGWNKAVRLIYKAPTIKPETLLIVQELIAEIADREDVSIIQHNEIHELRDTIKKLKDDIAQCKPVVHAHWVPIYDFGFGVDTYKCSKCGRKIYVPSLLCLDEMGVIKNYPYCHCGAKMDEVIEE